MKRPEIVTCQHCGNDVPSRKALGVGPVHRAVWTCNDCIITPGALDAVFAPIGAAINAAIQDSVKEATP